MQVLMNWIVTISGGIYMALMIAMASRFAMALEVGGRRQWLLAGVAFLAISCLLSSLGIYYRGPLQVTPGPVSWCLAIAMVYIASTVLAAWGKQIISQH